MWKRSKRQADRAGRKAFYEPEFTYGKYAKLSQILIDIKNLSRRAFAFSIVNCRESAARTLARACFYWSWQIGWASITRIPKYRCSRFPGLLGHAANEEKREQQSILECEKIKRQADRAGRKAFYEPEFTYGKYAKALANSWLISRIYHESFCIFHSELPRIGGSKKTRSCLFLLILTNWLSQHYSHSKI